MVIGKIGYGTYAECLINGVPLMYVPRWNFAEHPIIEKSISKWGYGYSISKDEFYNLRWYNALEQIKKTSKPTRIISNGAEKCFGKIKEYIKLNTLHS